MELEVTHQVIRYLVHLLGHVSTQIRCDVVYTHIM